MIPAVSTEQRMEEPPETAISQESTFERLKNLQYIIKKEGAEKALSKSYYIYQCSDER